RDVAASRLADQPRTQQVECEVPGARADLQRAVPAGRLGAESLADLCQHLRTAHRAEVDAPLVVVVVRRHVVVTRVRVADLLGAQRRRHERAPYTRAPRLAADGAERAGGGYPHLTSRVEPQ